MHSAGRKVLNPFLSREFRCSFSRTCKRQRQPNPPLDLDPSLQALLRDVDASLARHKHKPTEYPAPRELDVLPTASDSSETIFDTATTTEEVDWSYHSQERKSPAALFGSQRIGAVTLPIELQNAIHILINESDKAMLHTDARRLFAGEEGEEEEWNSSYDKSYKSYKQAARHSERDGTAFATIALPPHYSAIRSVLENLNHRMRPDWNVESVIDWGAGTGSGLWAALHTFQKSSTPEMEDLKASNTTLSSYIGIEKRDGLTSIAKRLVKDLSVDDTTVSWQRSFRPDDKIPRSVGYGTLALSAFNLSAIPTSIARKALVKEMWESGAHTIVLIDHSTQQGFQNIADAREVLLNMGSKELQDPSTVEWPIRGSHVVAPVLSARWRLPADPSELETVCLRFLAASADASFVRHTKHSKAGHEDIGYSYVVVQRGERPANTTTRLGRLGAVGFRQLEKETDAQVPIKELTLHSEPEPSPEAPIQDLTQVEGGVSQEDLDATFRQEAFHWPRKIMRLTIPKSQGKQPFYDARKSSWGDMFPHEPKNSPQVRFPVSRSKVDGPTKKGSAGKALASNSQRGGISYEDVAEKLKESKKQARRDRIAQTRVRRELKESETHFPSDLD